MKTENPQIQQVNDRLLELNAHVSNPPLKQGACVGLTAQRSD